MRRLHFFVTYNGLINVYPGLFGQTTSGEIPWRHHTQIHCMCSPFGKHMRNQSSFLTVKMPTVDSPNWEIGHPISSAVFVRVEQIQRSS